MALTLYGTGTTNMTQRIDNRGTIEQPILIELRGRSGKLYGMLDCQSLIIEFKAQRRGSGSVVEREQVDLKPYLEAAKHDRARS
jgi:hypothetical protein